MSDELQELVNRFLAWKLPTDFYPDCHIHFDREKAEKWGPQLWPSGTNLLNADQARAMLEHVTEPLRTQFADTERDNANLRTVMIAAAEEIATHWTAHCNAEGYGPINLLRRLQEGIAAQYGYTGGGWARINSELATLRTQLAAMTAERDAERAKVAVLREALAGIELFFVRPGETINEKFERIGHVFHKATGMLRPGKDASMHCPHTYEEREKAFDEWCTAKAAAARNALEATK